MARGSYRSSYSGKSNSSGRGYSSARAHQKCGTSFGGYTKVQTGKNTFTMVKTDKK